MRKLLIFAALAVCQTIWAQDAMQIVKDMAPGWNLGNTLEVPQNNLSAETAWQPTKTSQDIIDFVKEQGFRSVRIPCAWHAHFMPSTTTIDETWMKRVKEVVDYCINDGMYVVLNSHWDGGWLENSFTDTSEATVTAKCDTLKQIWTQIANEFKDYDNKLLFAGLNEPAVENATQMTALLRYEQAFVDAVRATGGNNSDRVLVIQGPTTDIDKTVNLMNTLPTDTAVDKLALEVHYYAPWNFWGMMNDESWGNMFFYWGSENHVSGSSHNATYGEEDFLMEQLDKIGNIFPDKHIPIIIGEYGANWRNIKGTGESQEKHNASIKHFYKTLNIEAMKRGMAPMVWCTNYANRPSMTIINRSNLSIYNQYAMDGIKEALSSSRIVCPENTAPPSPMARNVVFDLQGRVVSDDINHIGRTSGIYIYNGKIVRL